LGAAGQVKEQHTPHEITALDIGNILGVPFNSAMMVTHDRACFHIIYIEMKITIF